jgi:hypothetical protein
VAKITVNGETFDYEGRKQLTHEALWIEHVYKRSYSQWQDDLSAGSARAMCMLACLLWRRDGRNVDTAFQDMLDGKIEWDLNEMLVSIMEGALAAQQEAEAEADPTPSRDPDGTPGTAADTRGSSPSASGSARGKSGSSKSRTSRPSSTT